MGVPPGRLRPARRHILVFAPCSAGRRKFLLHALACPVSGDVVSGSGIAGVPPVTSDVGPASLPVFLHFAVDADGHRRTFWKGRHAAYPGRFPHPPADDRSHRHPQNSQEVSLPVLARYPPGQRTPRRRPKYARWPSTAGTTPVADPDEHAPPRFRSPGTGHRARSDPAPPVPHRSWSPGKCITERKITAQLVKEIDTGRHGRPPTRDHNGHRPALARHVSVGAALYGRLMTAFTAERAPAARLPRPTWSGGAAR